MFETTNQHAFFFWGISTFHWNHRMGKSNIGMGLSGAMNHGDFFKAKPTTLSEYVMGYNYMNCLFHEA
jgi:hypothetical protein